MPNLRHYDHLNTARFVTFSCHQRLEFLTRPAIVEVFLQTLQWIRTHHGIRIFGYVVMPEHVHLVLYPPDSIRLGPIIGELKSKSASRIISEKLLVLPGACAKRKDGKVRQAFWQPRCYDHNCRTQQAVSEKIIYCHKNPVTRGLVAHPDQWPWSSHNWYCGAADTPLEIDRIE